MNTHKIMSLMAVAGAIGLIVPIAAMAAAIADVPVVPAYQTPNPGGGAILTPNITGLTDSDLGIQYGAATGLTNADPRLVAARIIKASMQVLGILALVIVLIGGYTWMTAGGNEEKVGEAKKWILAGVIGLIIIFSAYAITSFVISQLVRATVG